MKLQSVNEALGIATKVIALGLVATFAPAIANEVKWLSSGKPKECQRLSMEYKALIASTSGLNTRVFSPGEGSAINQAFLGTVLASATQGPNAKLIQASIYGCPTANFPVQITSW